MSDSSPVQVTCSILVLKLTQPQLSGDIQAQSVRDELLTIFDQARPDNVILDFSAVTYISSSGITPLLTLVKAVREREGRLILVGLNREIEGVFVATRLIGTSKSLPTPFEHQTDVAAAVAVLTSK